LPAVARDRRSCAGWAAVAVAALILQPPGHAQISRPLPDPKIFFDGLRKNLARSQDLQKLYAYKERRTNLNLNPFGRIGTGGTRVIEVTPRPDGAVDRQVLERDGQPVANSPVLRRESRMPTGRPLVDDVAAALDVAMDRREMLNGRPHIVVTFHGKPDARPKTREGRLARAFSGLIWIDENAQEVARVDATAVDDMSFGYGMLARLNSGSTVMLLREPIDQELWLPTSIRFAGEGRALLFRKLIINFAIDWFDYRRAL
jgi:hypothetical protein